MSEQTKCIGSDGKEYFRQKCQVITRVMGYLRGVDNYNVGKKSEFYSRKYFRIDEAMLMAESNEKVQSMIESNRIFNSKYGNGGA